MSHLINKILFCQIIVLFLFIFPTYVYSKVAIRIITISAVDGDLINYLKNNISTLFNSEVRVDNKENYSLEDAYNKNRNQYLASKILESFSEVKGLTVLIVDEDLYAEGLNFIFGQADVKKKVCIVSLKRLKQEFYGLKENKNLFWERALKITVHELGHLLGLSHCQNSSCVMWFANSILEVDRKSYNFCSICKEKIERLSKR